MSLPILNNRVGGFKAFPWQHPDANKTARLTIVEPLWFGRPHTSITYRSDAPVVKAPGTLLEVGQLEFLGAPVGILKDVLCVRVRDERPGGQVRHFATVQVNPSDTPTGPIYCWTEAVYCNRWGVVVFLPYYIEWQPFKFE